ncbi:MAG TPA: amino acid ABC transporter permease [Dehalococcoidia bacterium]|nr:amino acid ABC transporter permease [Dehalococcoidia bacterium]
MILGAGFEPFLDWPIWRFLLEGFWLTVRIAGYSIFLALVIGITMAVGRLAPIRPVSLASATYVEVFRATPLLLLIFFVFFGAGRLEVAWVRNLPLGSEVVDAQGHILPIPSVVIALTLYNSAVVAEITRAGILSISRGIIEASRSLGLTYLQSMRHVAIPMAVRRMAPGLVSQLVTLFKDTSLASILSIPELLRRGKLIYDNPLYANALETLTVVAIMYFIPAYCLSLIAQRLERGPEQRAAGRPPPPVLPADMAPAPGAPAMPAP